MTLGPPTWRTNRPLTANALSRINSERGQIIEFELADGDEVLGTVESVTADYAEVDFNHPLAGHAIDFEVEIVSVAPPQ